MTGIEYDKYPKEKKCQYIYQLHFQKIIKFLLWRGFMENHTKMEVVIVNYRFENLLTKCRY